MDKNIKKVTVTEFRARLSHYLKLLQSGIKIEVRGVLLGKVEDVHAKNKNVQIDVQTPVQMEDKTTKPKVHEFCDMVGEQANKIKELRKMVSNIENRGQVKSDPEPEGAYFKEEEEEEEEEEKFTNCDVCKGGKAEKTYYDAGDFGEVEICRQCARSRYMGSMRNFDKYWKGLQDIKIY